MLNEKMIDWCYSNYENYIMIFKKKLFLRKKIFFWKKFFNNFFE